LSASFFVKALIPILFLCVSLEARVLSVHFEWSGQAYSLHLKTPAYFDRLPAEPNSFLRALAGDPSWPDTWEEGEFTQTIDTWITERYAEMGLFPTNSYDERAAQILRDISTPPGVTAMAVVTPRSDRKQILASLRIEHQTNHHQRLTIDEYLIRSGQRQTPLPGPRIIEESSATTVSEYRLVPVARLGHLRFGLWPLSFRTLEAPYGAIAEIQSYNLTDDSEDFIPLLYAGLESLGLLSWSGRTYQRKPVRVGVYRCHCEGSARRYLFERLGWSLVEEYPNPFKRRVTNYVMEIDRSRFRHHFDSHILKRAGIVILHEGRFLVDKKIWQYPAGRKTRAKNTCAAWLADRSNHSAF